MRLTRTRVVRDGMTDRIWDAGNCENGLAGLYAAVDVTLLCFP